MVKSLMNITVLTATIPERNDMLINAMQSVAQQTIKPKSHIVLVDIAKQGNWNTYQKLLEMSDTEWVCFLDDDDIFYPNHLEKLIKNSDEADVIYSNCNTNDNTNWLCYHENYNYDRLQQECIVPITAMVKREWMLKVGGFDQKQDCDYSMWKKLANAGAIFKKINDITWQYNFHETNYSRKGKTW